MAIEKSPNVPPFISYCATLIPTVFDNSLSYYEALCALSKWLQDNLVTVVNNNAEVTEEYIKMTIDLKAYVDNYFENLDVQDEINNKLDEMVEGGQLQEIISEYLNSNALWCFDTVADMKLATNLRAGSYARTLGFYAVGDGGGALYKISDTGTANEMDVIAVDSLYANIVIPTVLIPEMLGAHADGTTDDYLHFVRALQISDVVKLSGKTYVLGTQLEVGEGKELSGLKDSLGYAKLNALNGLKIAGRRITVKNIELTGAGQSGYGLYCCGNNEGGSTDGANYFSQNIIKNMVISNYNYAIYFTAVVWNNTISNIRMNQNNYGIYSGATYYVMTTMFENVYFSGCKTYDVQMAKTSAKFNYCNFGISTYRCLQFTQGCNIQIDNSNFECDKYISGTGTLVEITGKNMTISNSAFKMCTANTISLFSTGSAVQNLELISNTYEGTSMGGASNAMVKIISDGITGAKYGCINIGNGNLDFPFNIENASRIPYGKYPYVRMNGLIQSYSDSDVTLANLAKGSLVWSYQTNVLKYYNGTALMTVTAS